MSFADSRFATNVAGGSGPFQNGTLANLDWNENPGYANGNQCWDWLGLTSSDILNMNKCRVDWREGPRIGSDAGTLNVDQSFISCVGKTGDHADGIQAFSSGGSGNLKATNTCFRSYTSAEAATVYGAGFIGSDAIQWADNFQGNFTFDNVLIWGGDRGVSIFADVGTTHVSFNNVYFAPGQFDSTYFPFYDYNIRATGGTLIVDRWTNVFAATVVGGVIIPGSSLPSP